LDVPVDAAQERYKRKRKYRIDSRLTFHGVAFRFTRQRHELTPINATRDKVGIGSPPNTTISALEQDGPTPQGSSGVGTKLK
jgi:hypothetical protein